AGTISGGCLEAEVAKKAWWLTKEGPVIQRYSSFFDEDSPVPYGLGCGGTVYVLLQQGAPAHAVLNALEDNLTTRLPFVIITDTDKAATLSVQRAGGEMLFPLAEGTVSSATTDLAQRALDERQSFYTTFKEGTDRPTQLFVEYVTPSP